MAGRSQARLIERQGFDSTGYTLRASALTAPTISGTPANASTLTAAGGTFKPATGPVITRQWLKNGLPIAGATDTTYVVAGMVSGDQISHRVDAATKWGTTSQLSNVLSVA